MAAAKQRTLVVGVFQDRLEADQAVDDLLKAGFRKDQIGVAMRHAEGTEATVDADGSHAESGAITGALAGLGLGALAGLGVMAGVIPVIGPAIAAGTLGVVLSNAAAGAGIAGLVGALVGAGLPEHEAKYYHEEFEAGRTIVTVTAGGRVDEATAILRRHGAYDMNTRSECDSTAVCHSESAAEKDSDTIQVKEERLHAKKQPVKTGEVTVRKEVHTETKNLEVPVQREEIVIERTPVRGRTTTSGIAAGEEIRIPVSEEQVHVDKETVVSEEVKVGKRVVQGTEHVSGQVRKEEVTIKKTGDVKTRDERRKSD